ncbi:hypothetical protein MUK51_02850 [Sphingobacterium faecium]|jgi:hypothetical protein|uniref:hypothetical protein n=1 Tax=Sphingobacterium faecium TaxID=34087 RepID=UPI0021B5249E|nr:hypothetical protein [Sphingobacterium faecium]UXD70231.1 hypothetical protein MUK51_02850 [Sphingobacterium faecium]
MKTKKYLLRFIYVYLIVGFMSNLPFVSGYIRHRIDGDLFKYSNADASFTWHDTFGFKSSPIDQWYIDQYITKVHPEKKNQKIYRLYKINPLCFWRWSYYLLISADYQYKSWKEIEPNRVPYHPENRYQAF